MLRSETINMTYPMEPYYYAVTAVTRDFADKTRFTLLDYDNQFTSEEEVWDEVLTNNDVALIDSFAGSVNPFGASGFFIGGIGDTVSIRQPDGNYTAKRIIGILDSMLVNGIFINQDVAYNEIGLFGQRIFFFKLAPGEDIHDASLTIERELLPYQVQTLELDSLIEELFAAQDSIFTLFNAFLGLGLIIGIAGLGIITIRAIHERRQQIGMLRAIGFKRSWVMAAFAMEASIITILGIIIGVLLGLDVGWNLWYSEFRPQDYAFYIPWGDILLYTGIAFIVTLLSTLYPSRKAAQVHPAEALRYE